MSATSGADFATSNVEFHQYPEWCCTKAQVRHASQDTSGLGCLSIGAGAELSPRPPASVAAALN